MDDKFAQMAAELKTLVENGLSPAQAMTQAGLLDPNNKEAIQEMLAGCGVPNEVLNNPEQMRQITQNLVAALDPAAKKSLGSFISQVMAQSGAGTPPPEVEEFIRGLVGNNPKP